MNDPAATTINRALWPPHYSPITSSLCDETSDRGTTRHRCPLKWEKGPCRLRGLKVPDSKSDSTEVAQWKFCGPSWPARKVSISGPEASGSKPDSTEEPSPKFFKSIGAICHPECVMRKFGDGLPAQMPFSSSDRGSKLRCQAQNSPPVTSKRDFDINKLNYGNFELRSGF
ncbi:hypothetical protein AVEN_246175-1 [Araneus ventricosus]|uniref:Uncharacterized protein n=1 Tax=Araneus ventricosus TaxID=182803 RepID=A0A4Y2J3P4_ARAVE|nr:hypothetical protein AVEN_246175-1 [Araneus ventricosus]